MFNCDPAVPGVIFELSLSFMVIIKNNANETMVLK